MKPRDIYGLIIRIVGLGILLFGVWYLVYALMQWTSLEKEETYREGLSNFVFGAFTSLISLYLVRGAPHLLRFSYRDHPDDSQPPKS